MTFRPFILSTLTLLAMTACMKEDIECPDTVGDILSFTAATSTGWNNNSSSETKAEMQIEDAEGNTINVNIAVVDGIASGLDSSVETKGTPLTASNFFTRVDNVGVYGYVNGTSTVFMGNSNFAVNGAENLSRTGTHDDDTYSSHWSTSRPYYWPKTNKLDFWSWAPMATIEAAVENTGEGVKISDFAIDNAAGKLTFSYDLGENTDAVDTPDLMFASKAGCDKNTTAGATGCVPLDFKHALAAVQFRIVSTKEHKLGDLKLVDVIKSGDCIYDGSSFAWTSESGNVSSYAHSFDTLLAKTASGTYKADLSGKTQSATFMMIPQTLGSQKLSLTVSIDEDSAPAEFTGLIPVSIVKKWEAGKTYIYTINIDEDVNVTITDEVSPDNVKSNVVVCNNGNVNAYIRADFSANWFDSKGKIINVAWDPEDSLQGTFEGLAADGSNWVKGEDGYYYYTKQVPAGRATVGSLFDTYTCGTCPGTSLAAKQAHLEMDVMVQAIQANLLIKADGKTFKTGAEAYGWDTSSLSVEIDSAD